MGARGSYLRWAWIALVRDSEAFRGADLVPRWRLIVERLTVEELTQEITDMQRTCLHYGPVTRKFNGGRGLTMCGVCGKELKL